MALEGDIDTIDGELLQREHLGVTHVEARYGAAVPDTGLAALSYQLLVALAVTDHDKLAEAVLRHHRVLPANY